jgi:hypothetical protein
LICFIHCYYYLDSLILSVTIRGTFVLNLDRYYYLDSLILSERPRDRTVNAIRVCYTLRAAALQMLRQNARPTHDHRPRAEHRIRAKHTNQAEHTRNLDSRSRDTSTYARKYQERPKDQRKRQKQTGTGLKVNGFCFVPPRKKVVYNPQALSI